MRHIDLFSGIGGFSLAASWVWGAEHEIVTFCEKDPFCQKVLAKHWPGVGCVSDIHELKGEEYGSSIDLITGGFPCQCFSVAGKRQGQEDDRYLWPEMFRIVKEVHPRWVIGENVAGIINMALDEVLSDMEGEGYETGTVVVPACAVNAPHRRDRVWIVAYSASMECTARAEKQGVLRRVQKDGKKCDNIGGSSETCEDSDGRGIASYSTKPGLSHRRRTPMADSRETQSESQRSDSIRGGNGNGTHADVKHVNDRRLRTSEISQFTASRVSVGQQWEVEPGICRVADGFPGRVDRLKALGNAIVPQVAAVIMQAIKQIDEMR